MKALPFLIAFGLSGCASAPIPLEAPRAPPAVERNCPPLPELASRPTPAQRDVHMARVVDLYLQCAGVTQ